MRKALVTYGTHGRSCRVFIETFRDASRQSLVRVQWREGGKLRTESLPNTRENQAKAKAFAAATSERLALKGPDVRERVTVLELGNRYRVAHPVPMTWRPKSLTTFNARWKVCLAFLTPERAVDTMNHDLLDAFREAMGKQGYAVNQIVNHVQLIKSMYRFAKARKYLTENPIADYEMKLSRDQRRLSVPEWTNAECAAILAQLSPKHGRQWRAHVAIVLDAVLGGRSNALLHLEWRDVDLLARTIRWRPELDKLANDRVQPLPRDAVRALRIAIVWRRRIGYTGPYVLPGARGTNKHTHPYRYQSLNASLKAAAARAGVTWIDYRAMHGFRRMVVGNVLAMTGNLVRAGQYIGDTDARTLSRSYVRPRPEELRDVSHRMRLTEAQPNSEQPSQPNRNRKKKPAPDMAREGAE